MAGGEEKVELNVIGDIVKDIPELLSLSLGNIGDCDMTSHLVGGLVSVLEEISCIDGEADSYLTILSGELRELNGLSVDALVEKDNLAVLKGSLASLKKILCVFKAENPSKLNCI